jgi:hypothetical protein
MSNLKGLPKTDPAFLSEGTLAIDRARICRDCGNETRLVSNSEGIEAYCGPCKKHWPVASTPMETVSFPTTARGLSKQTLVEPDWNRAFDSPQGDPLNEQIGPKQR